MEDLTGVSNSEKRRRRPPLACVSCRRRKVRCDRKMPCQNCVKARTATSCAYVPDERLEPRQGTQRLSNGINGRNFDRDDVVNAHVGGRSDWSAGTTPASSSNQQQVNANPYGEAENLRDRVRQLEHQLKEVLDSKNTGADAAPRTKSAQLPRKHADSSTTAKFLGEEYFEIDGPQRAEHLHPESTNPSGTRAMLAKSRYLGSSHWMHGVNLFPRTNTCITFLESLKSDNNSEVYQTLIASKRLGRVIKAARVPHLSSLEFGQHIPKREAADKLLEAYFRTFESVHRIIHVPSFRLEYGRYWQDPQGARDAFVIQLQLCMALGTLMQDDTYSMRSLAVRWIYEARLWLLQPSEKSRIDVSGLQILCLVHLARDACGVAADLVWASAGTLMRMAIHTGLHRDPDYLPKMPLLAAEIRRRLWATIMEILALSSMESGGPPLVTMQDFDTKPPGNFNDEDLQGDNPSAQPPSPRHVTTFTDTSIQIALLSRMKIRLQISSYLNDFRSAQTYDKTLVLNSELTSASRSFDALLRSYESQQPGLSAMQLAITEHIIQRYFLALHMPWLGLAKNDPRYYFSRKLCIEVALRNQKEGMAHGFLGADSGSELDDFGRLLICASSGYRYVGTQCLLVLVLELMWELEEHRTALRSLDTSPSGLNRSASAHKLPSTPGMGFGLLGSQLNHSNEMLSIIRHSLSWTRARMKAGETNIKGYLFRAAMLAEAEGQLRGLTDAELTPLVQRAASEAAKEAYDILKELHASQSGNGDRRTEGVALGMEGYQASGKVATSGLMDPGSSSTMNEWDWDALSDPNYTFNLNFGALDLIFGNEGM